MACEDVQQTCVISQTTMAADQTWLGTVQVIVADADAPTLPVVFRVPEGVHLASGLFYADGSGTPRKAEWLHCEPGSCLAVAELDAAGQAAWQRGTTAEVRYRPNRTAPAIAVEVSLLGVTAALQAAREAMR